MDFHCEDLPQHRLLLVSSASPDYAPLLADIQRRFGQPVDGSPPIPEQYREKISERDRANSAILLNQNTKPVAALQVVWYFEDVAGRSYRHSHRMLSGRPLLLPFGVPENVLRMWGYWKTILPGSKRYLGESGMVGDNTDVRLPSPDEKWPTGRGMVVGFRGGGGSARDPLKSCTLVLDGEFIGPNLENLFEKIVADADAHMLVATIARQGHNQGLPPTRILAEINKVTGPAPERPSMTVHVQNQATAAEELRQSALQNLAYEFATGRKSPGYSDEQMVYMIMDWTTTLLPKFRRG